MNVAVVKTVLTYGACSLACNWQGLLIARWYKECLKAKERAADHPWDGWTDWITDAVDVPLNECAGNAAVREEAKESRATHRTRSRPLLLATSREERRLCFYDQYIQLIPSIYIYQRRDYKLTNGQCFIYVCYIDGIDNLYWSLSQSQWKKMWIR